jgi:hypothetical protein
MRVSGLALAIFYQAVIGYVGRGPADAARNSAIVQDEMA